MTQQTRIPVSSYKYALDSKLYENVPLSSMRLGGCTKADFLVTRSHPLYFSFSVATVQRAPLFSSTGAADQTTAASPVSAQANAAAAAASSSPVASPTRARAGSAAAMVRLSGRASGRRHDTGMRLADRREYGVCRLAAASRREDTDKAATELPPSPSTASRLPQL